MATRLSLLVLSMSLFSITALAQDRCDAYFSFDGNLNDSSGNGYDGRMIAAEGELVKPQFVDGKVGKALKLDGTSAMRAFVDLNHETCKQVTMTAWVMFEPGRPSKTANIISTGGGSGPGLRTSGPTLTLKGTANGLMQSNAIRENAGWMFVAGVYDYSGDEYTLYWRGRSKSKALGPNLRTPEEAIWVGALNDGLSGAASGVMVDELRIYGRLLSEDELRGMQANRVPGFATQQPTRQVAANTCAAQSDCGSGSYCAFDRSCHPESHLPLREVELTRAPAPIQTVIPALGNDAQNSSGSSSGIPGVIPGVADRLPANSGLSEKTYDALQDKVNEGRPPEIGYASEEEALAAAERREREAYEAELSRQQNELERQRREEAAAAAAAKDEQMPAAQVNAVMDLQKIEITRQNEKRGDEYYIVTYKLRGRRGADDRIHVFDYADQVWPLSTGENWAKVERIFSIPQGAGRLTFNNLKPFEVYGYVALLMEANNSSVADRTAAFGFGEFQNEQGVVQAISSAFERAVPRSTALPDYSNTSCDNVLQVFNQNYQGISIQFGNYELRNSGLSKTIQEVISVPLKGSGTDIFDGAIWAFHMNVPGGDACVPSPPVSKAFIGPGTALRSGTFSTRIHWEHTQYK